MLEGLLENQQKFLENHDIKIQEIENVINKIVADKGEKDNHKETGRRALALSSSFNVHSLIPWSEYRKQYFSSFNQPVIHGPSSCQIGNQSIS